MAIDAADALGRIGPAARPALKRLAQMLASDQTAVQWAAVRAMSQIGGEEAKPAVAFMIRALPTASEADGYNMMIYLALLGPVAKDAVPSVRNSRIMHPVLPSATLWAIESDGSLPWAGSGGMGRGDRGGRGGPGGGPGGAGLLIYESFVHELGDRLRPAGLNVARQIVAGTAGNMPDWGYKLLACGTDGAVAILAPRLADEQAATRERVVVALGRMGPAAAAGGRSAQGRIGQGPDRR